jgi:hypothetical protein
MAGPIALASALSRLVTIKCPWCGHQKAVSRQPVSHRVCARCHKHFPDPLAKPKKRK